MALKYSDTDSAGSNGSESLSSKRHANGSELTGSVGELDGSGDGVTSVDGGGVTLVDRGSVTSLDRGGVTLVEMALNGEVNGSARGVSSLEVTLVVIAFILSTSSSPW